MAEDTNHILPINEINEIDEDKSKDDSDKKPLAAKKRIVAVPHYLRASTGSCHDACKYGKPHVFKEKPWKAVRRLSAPLPRSEKTVDIQIFADRKVKKTVGVDNPDRAPSYETPTSNATLRRSFLSSRKSPLHDSLKSVKQEAELFKKSPVHDSSKLVKQEARPFKKSPSHASKVMKKAVRSPGRSSLSDMPKLPEKDVLLKPTPPNPRVRSVSAGPIRPNRSVVSPSLSPGVFKGLGGKAASEIKFSDPTSDSSTSVRKVLTTPAATILSVKRSPKLEMKKPLVPSEATTSRSSSSTSVRKVLTTPATTILSVKRSPKLDMKPLVPLKATTSSSRVKPVKSVDVRKTNGISRKNRIIGKKGELKQADNEMVEERTLHMIEIKDDSLACAPISTHFIQSPSPLSPESLNSSSQGNSLSLTSHELESDTGSTDSDADDSISNYKRNTRNYGVDEDPTSLKLKFRRGKVVDLEAGTHSPKKLRYKERIITGDDQVASSGPSKKNYTKRVVDSEQKEASSDQEKVALKHQEMVTKDEQVLYNNVIEETASKLVEKRKSKVKALVGAFETVISLQERKPTASNK